MQLLLLPTILTFLLPLALADFRPVHVPPGCHALCDPIANLTLICHTQGHIHGADYAACMCSLNAGNVRLALCAACVNFHRAPGHGINVLVKSCFLTQTVFVGTATEDDGTATVQTVTVTVDPTESLDDATTTATAVASSYGTAGASATGAVSTVTPISTSGAVAAATSTTTTRTTTAAVAASGLSTVASSSISSGTNSGAAAVATANGSGAGKAGVFGGLMGLVVGGLAVVL